METLTLVVWWIGLIGSLILTLVILKQVSLVLDALRGIHTLAELTRDAGRGIADHVQTVPRLGNVAEPAIATRDAIHALALTAGTLERRLAGISPRPSPGSE